MQPSIGLSRKKSKRECVLGLLRYTRTTYGRPTLCHRRNNERERKRALR